MRFLVFELHVAQQTRLQANLLHIMHPSKQAGTHSNITKMVICNVAAVQLLLGNVAAYQAVAISTCSGHKRSPVVSCLGPQQ